MHTLRHAVLEGIIKPTDLLCRTTASGYKCTLQISNFNANGLYMNVGPSQITNIGDYACGISTSICSPLLMH